MSLVLVLYTQKKIVFFFFKGLSRIWANDAYKIVGSKAKAQI